jgi:hypothetical protein
MQAMRALRSHSDDAVALLDAVRALTRPLAGVTLPADDIVHQVIDIVAFMIENYAPAAAPRRMQKAWELLRLAELAMGSAGGASPLEPSLRSAQSAARRARRRRPCPPR